MILHVTRMYGCLLRVSVFLVELLSDYGCPVLGKAVKCAGTAVVGSTVSTPWDRQDGPWDSQPLLVRDFEHANNVILTTQHLQVFAACKGDLDSIANKLVGYEQGEATKASEAAPPPQGKPMIRGLCSPAKHGEDLHTKVAAALLSKEKKQICSGVKKWMEEVKKWRKGNNLSHKATKCATEVGEPSVKGKHNPWEKKNSEIFTLNKEIKELRRTIREQDRKLEGEGAEGSACAKLESDLRVEQGYAQTYKRKFEAAQQETEDIQKTLNAEKDAHKQTKDTLASKDVEIKHMLSVKELELKLARSDGYMASLNMTPISGRTPQSANTSADQIFDQCQFSS